jgi:succinate dehydrogenase/fumarate reductase flavoprotein subunit
MSDSNGPGPALEADVAIVGGGMAGLVAALAAGERGATALVLERGATVGGSMAISGGLIWGPASFELAREWIPRGDPELQRLFTDELSAAWDWLEGNGLPLEPAARCLKDEMGIGRLMGLGAPGARLPWAQALAGAATERGAKVRVGAEVTGLERAGDRWRLGWRSPEGEHAADAAAVVFSGGGFHNHPELVRRYVTPWPERMVIRGNRTSDGIALRSLLPLGAEPTRGMHSFYGHTLPWVDGKDWGDGTELLAGSLYFSDYCLIVNQLGLRFGDESVGCIDEHNAQAGCRQPQGRYYLLFDERLRRERIDADLVGIPGLKATQVASKLDQVAELGGTIVGGADRAELAAAMEEAFGVPAANVEDSIRTYNEAGDPIGALDPPRRRDHVPLVEAPLRAIACVAGITYTMGGLRVDPEMRVQGDGLDRVYAAGADAGNVFEDVYGGGLGWAAVSGRRAGTAAAQSVAAAAITS